MDRGARDLHSSNKCPGHWAEPRPISASIKEEQNMALKLQVTLNEQGMERAPQLSAVTAHRGSNGIRATGSYLCEELEQESGEQGVRGPLKCLRSVTSDLRDGIFPHPALCPTPGSSLFILFYVYFYLFFKDGVSP